MRKVSVIAAILLASITSPASAATILDFTITAGGSVSYAGGSAGLVGVLSVSAVQIQGDATSSLTLSNATLNFNTGDTSHTSDWQWTGGGATNFIALVGGIPSLGIPDGTVLLSGTFGAAQIVSQTAVDGSFTDFKDPTLLRHFGLPNLSYDGSLNFGVDLTGASVGTAFTAEAGAGSLLNNVQPVPEPATIMLLGPALLGLRAYRRRRLTQRVGTARLPATD